MVVNARSHKNEQDHSSECREKCAQKRFDRADTVIALGKRGRGGAEDEAVKPLDGVQRVKVPHGQSERAGR
jgi:hypothetical protein